MKIGIFSDLHLHKFAPFGAVDGNRRLQDGLDILVHIIRIFIKKKCGYGIFLGDWFDSRKAIDKETMLACKNVIRSEMPAIEKSGIKFKMIPGNHDWYDNNFRVHGLDFLKDAFDFEIIDMGSGAMWDNNAQAIMSYLPWNDADTTRYCLDTWARELRDRQKGKLSLLFIHAQPAGAKTPAGFEFKGGIDFSQYEDAFDVVFCGDIHKHQKLGNVRVVGAPMHQTFADRGERRGVMVMDTKTRKVKFYALNKYFPNFIITSDPDDLNDKDYFRFVTDQLDHEVDADNVEVIQMTDDVPDDRYGVIDYKAFSRQEIITNYAKDNTAGLNVEKLIKYGLEMLP